ncbi:Protein CHLOROPLAST VESICULATION [Cardamine amara subsp. amara]|uniref:Protein CHLOROPLAST VESICULATION n=1 Tax=Cardamine amara subsp. amara TaxID=228776 RepID=A0ABD1A676_CARAN
MAGRISCCLNLPLLDSNSTQSSSPLLKTTSKISWRRTEDATEPRTRKCSLVLGVVATVVIGAIQISDVASVEAAVVKSPMKDVAVGVAPLRRWSDKRTCPPWLENSLETIVPENLPRPSAHRRLELARLAKGDAPPVGAVVTRANRAGCFSV